MQVCILIYNKYFTFFNVSKNVKYIVFPSIWTLLSDFIYIYIFINSLINLDYSYFRFCSFLGPVFSFVKTEIVSKSEVMNDLINNCQEDHFETVKNMIQHEKESQLLTKKHYVSGCRTFLRLHRGLGNLIIILSL